MAAVLLSPSQFPSSSSTSFSNDGPRHSITLLSDDSSTALERESAGEGGQERKGLRSEEEEDQLCLLALLVAVLRKSVVRCRTEREKDLMDIGLPTDVRHVAHVTFDRFHGFLGLPVEFEPEVPMKALSASTNVFGVSAKSMQCSFDCRGNSVPTILLLMQRRLYEQGGLQAEGIFRINAENTQEEDVRDQLNSGNLPDGIDVHCLAGLIKAWFRELPTGVLDTLSSEQVMQCQREDECVALVKLLPPTESSLLDWAINLMADVVQEEHCNKMNAHNIAMVFAPNMTHMDDALTALMHAVQVMNFLKTLIERTLKERKETMIEATQASHADPSDKNDHHSSSRVGLEVQEGEQGNERILLNPCHLPEDGSVADNTLESSRLEGDSGFDKSMSSSDEKPREFPKESANVASASQTATDGLKAGCPEKPQRNKSSHPSDMKHKKTVKKVNGQPPLLSTTLSEKSRAISIISRINSRVKRVEAWR